MTADPEWFTDAILSAEADQVGNALDRLRQTWPDERPPLYTECIPQCCEGYRTGDWPQRQSVVRLFGELAVTSVGLTGAELGGDEDEPPLSGIERTLLGAIRDNDERVRKPARLALASLAMAYGKRGETARLRRLHGILGTFVAASDRPLVTRSIQRAREAVAQECDGDLSERLVCPRCSDTVEHWTFGDTTSVRCVACGYLGMETELTSPSMEQESWEEAMERFRDRGSAD